MRKQGKTLLLDVYSIIYALIESPCALGLGISVFDDPYVILLSLFNIVGTTRSRLMAVRGERGEENMPALSAGTSRASPRISQNVRRPEGPITVLSASTLCLKENNHKIGASFQ